MNKLGTPRLNEIRKFKMILLGLPEGLIEEDLKSELQKDDILMGKEIDIIKIFKSRNEIDNAIIAMVWFGLVWFGALRSTLLLHEG